MRAGREDSAMKRTGKALSLVLAAVLLLALSVTALADEPAGNDSVTVANAKAGETYQLYNLLMLENDAYTVNEDWELFLVPDGAGGAFVERDADGAVTRIADAASLAQAASVWSGKPSVLARQMAAGESVSFTGLEDGCWLITSSVGSFAVVETNPAEPDVTISLSNPENTVQTTVKEDSSDVFGDACDAQIGDAVAVSAALKLVKGARDVVVHVRLTDGLTVSAESIAVSGLTTGVDYTVAEAPEDGDTFDLAFRQSWLDGLTFGATGYREFQITCTAILNERAVAADDGAAIREQSITTGVTYAGREDRAETAVTVTTHSFCVHTHASGREEPLGGAFCELRKRGAVVPLVRIDDQNYRVAAAEEPGTVPIFSSAQAGDVTIWGVDADDDYTLYQTQAPEGFRVSTTELEVSVSAANDTRIDVVCKEAFEQHAIDERVFYVGGGLLAAAAIGRVLLRKRKRAEP